MYIFIIYIFLISILKKKDFWQFLAKENGPPQAWERRLYGVSSKTQPRHTSVE